MDERTPLSNAVSAFSLLLAMVVEDLDQSGAISRGILAKRIRELTDEAERTAPEHLKTDPRVDLQIARHFARLIDPEAPPSPHGWTPIVIEGGAQEQGQD